MRFAKQWALTGLATVVLMGVPREAAAFWDWIHELSGPSMMGFGYTCRLTEPVTFGTRSVRYDVVTTAAHTLSPGSPLTIASRNFGVTSIDPPLRFSIDVPASIPDATVRADLLSLYKSATITLAPALSFDRCFMGSNTGTNRLNVSDRFHWWVRYQSYFYYSVKHKDDPDGPHVYAFTHGGLFEFGPSHPGAPGENVLFYGAGVECFRFWSGADRFDAFDRCAIKLRPLGIRFNPPPGRRILGAKALEVGMDTRYFPRAFVPRDFGVNIGPEERDGGEWTIGFFFSAVLR